MYVKSEDLNQKQKTQSRINERVINFIKNNLQIMLINGNANSSNHIFDLYYLIKCQEEPAKQFTSLKKHDSEIKKSKEKLKKKNCLKYNKSQKRTRAIVYKMSFQQKVVVFQK